MNNEKQILVGKIVAPQGLRGEFRVHTFSQKPEDFKSFHIQSAKNESGQFHFVRVLGRDMIVARIDGINNRNDAETLRGTELFVLRSSLPKLKQDEYYQTDLIGFDVVREGIKIGTVAGFQNFGAGDIIELNNGEMVSFVGASVDFDNRKISVN